MEPGNALSQLTKRFELRFLLLCMLLLGLAAGWLLTTRPRPRIEGEFLEREELRQADGWLFQRLEDPAAENRARACLALGRIRNPAAVEHLLKRLRDPAASVRASAAFALGLLEDAQYLERTPREDVSAALADLLNDAGRTVVAAAAESLGRMRARPAARRLAACSAPLAISLTAVARMEATELAPWAAAWLRSDDQDSRWAATLALVEMGAVVDDDLRASFVKLTRDRNNFVRAAAARGLGRAESSKDAIAALDHLTGDLDPKIRFEALAAMARLGDQTQNETVVRMLGDTNENVAAQAVRTLGALGDARARPLLEQLRGARRPLSTASVWALQALAAGDSVLLEEPPRDPLPDQEPPAEIGQPFSAARCQEIARTLGRRLRFETTDGDFDLALDYDNAPAAAERLYRSAVAGKLNNWSFVRVAPNGYIQAGPGDPAAAPPPQRPQLSRAPFLRGSVGVVRSETDREGPELFIALTSLPFAEGRYTHVGRLSSGDDIIDEITVETSILRVSPVSR